MEEHRSFPAPPPADLAGPSRSLLEGQPGLEPAGPGRLGLTLGRAARLLERRLSRIWDRHGLSEARFAVLVQLAANPDPWNLHDLADRLGISRSNLTNVLDGLEEEGLARREPDRADRRALRAAITDRGRAVLQAVLPEQVEAAARALRHLTAREREQLARLLDKIVQALLEG